jgi:hypothetical protein
MSASSYAPIAVFAYNRLDRLRTMFDSLRQCDGFSSSAVTIFVDGPKTSDDSLAVGKVREFAQSIALPNVQVLAREENLGLRRSIWEGVSQISSSAGRVIVLEDDFELSPDILSYFNAALKAYQDVPVVSTVCAYTPQVKKLRSYNTAIFLPMPHPWGWATWHRAWSGFDIFGEIDHTVFRSRAFRERINVHGIRNFLSMLRLDQANRVNSWFIRWHYHSLLRNGLSVFPPRPLVANHGLDGGSHATRLNLFKGLLPEVELGKFDFALPSEAKLDFWAADAIRDCRESAAYRMINMAGRLRRMIFN